MQKPEYYQVDVLAFFSGRAEELALYQTLTERMERLFPLARVKVQKSQISFYAKHLFAAVSLPVRRKRDWPERCILVTFGLASRCPSPRIAVAVEPYPNRWTHHVVVAAPEEIDGELLGWLEEAYQFAQSK